MKTETIPIRGIIVLGILMLASIPASGATITFADDLCGPKSNGWRSAESPLLSFADTQGSNLEVNSFSRQAMGLGLAVRGDDASKLRLNFTPLADSLSLSFGNDDPGYCRADDVAVLQVFRGETLVGQTTMELNRDDVMNQSIGLDCVLFDRALFYYGSPDLNPNELIEVVDNISFTTVIPEPAAVTLVLLGLAGWAWMRANRSVETVKK